MDNASLCRRRRKATARRGVAAVEFAIVAPLFALLLLGAVDVGQLCSCYQKVRDVSREAGRVAVRSHTETTIDVEQAVIDYLGNAFPKMSTEAIRAATTVNVYDASGNSVIGDGLDDIEGGAQIRVVVALKFDQVRWITALPMLTGAEIQSATFMRRQ